MVVFCIQQAASLLLAVVYPLLAAQKDFIQIDANGSIDSLKADWHRINVWIRVAAFGCLAVAANTEHWWVAPAYFALSAAIFWLLFDYRLNILRGLEPGYVGNNSDADRLIKFIVMRFNYSLEEAGKRVKWAGLAVAFLLYIGSIYFVFPLNNLK